MCQHPVAPTLAILGFFEYTELHKVAPGCITCKINGPILFYNTYYFTDCNLVQVKDWNFLLDTCMGNELKNTLEYDERRL